ncbi:MAG: hypothetical protein AAF813_04135 [Pseudomonadota bacterium]
MLPRIFLNPSRVLVLLGLLAVPGWGHAKELTLSAPAALAETGFLKYVLPRFSLKTSIRINLTEDPALAELVISAASVGRPLVTDTRDGVTYGIAAVGEPAAEVTRFLDWLSSETGQRTLDAHRIEGAQVFTVAVAAPEAVVEAVPEGDIVLGEELSLSLCGRCHVVSEKNRAKGIGSTPSFAALKALRDWDFRFQVFYTLNPHPSFTQVEGITDPFDPMRPPPIVPIAMDVDALDAILAYVTSLAPLDLGAQIELK